MSTTIPTTQTHRRSVPLAAAAILVGVTVFLVGELTPGYDHRYDTVSRLASPGQPYAVIVRSVIVAFGVLVAWTAWALRTSGAIYRRGMSLPVGVAGATTMVVGIAPKDPPEVAPTTVSQVHVAAALIGVGALATAMAYVTRSSPHRVERHLSAAALTLLAIAGTAFPFAWGSVIYGLLQRVVLVTALGWLIGMARLTQAAAPSEASRPRSPHIGRDRNGVVIRRAGSGSLRRGDVRSSRTRPWPGS